VPAHAPRHLQFATPGVLRVRMIHIAVLLTKQAWRLAMPA
jgi:hypothetical protein